MLGLVILVVIRVAIAVFADLIGLYSKCIEQDGVQDFDAGSRAFLRDGSSRPGLICPCGSRFKVFSSIGVFISLMALVIGAVLGSQRGIFRRSDRQYHRRIMVVFICVPNHILMSLAVVQALGNELKEFRYRNTISCIPGKLPIDPSVSRLGLWPNRIKIRRQSPTGLPMRALFLDTCVQRHGADHCKHDNEHFPA